MATFGRFPDVSLHHPFRPVRDAGFRSASAFSVPQPVVLLPLDGRLLDREHSI
jgi:hypothetical protein